MYDESKGELYKKFDEGYEWYTKEGKLLIRTTDYHPVNLEVSIGELEALVKKLKSQKDNSNKE